MKKTQDLAAANSSPAGSSLRCQLHTDRTGDDLMGYTVFQEARRNLWRHFLYIPQKLQASDFSVTQEEVNCLLPTTSVPVPRHESTIQLLRKIHVSPVSKTRAGAILWLSGKMAQTGCICRLAGFLGLPQCLCSLKHG